mmetsp:Transcript_15290/g.35786  ORF Transcript_15290/g.35786 Transcript_15290/m.35786 type:complete len:466 (-) Transcript_15290:87-1484(-)
MPGTRDKCTSESWFEETLGFRERDYRETKRNLEFFSEILSSKVNGRTFRVGPFDLPTLAALQNRSEQNRTSGLGVLTFGNVVASTRDLHLDPNNAGAVFQVCSLFNCLETTEAGRGPEAGVTSYARRPWQGPAAAMACPAATIYRNYYMNGGQLDNEVDCMAALGAHVHNDEERYWTMVRGHCIPVMAVNLAVLSKRLRQEPDLRRQVRSKVQVGIHWSTQVATGTHQVCQVFCSALPIALMKQRPAAEWSGLADALLDAAFDATLTAGAVLAAERGNRVKVYLTALGAGELGNRRDWIIHAMDSALKAHATSPLDVMLVHYAEVPPAYYTLEEGRSASRAPPSTMDSQLTALKAQSLKASEAYGSMVRKHGDSEVAKLSAAFAYIDSNGDGVIDRRELMHALSSLDGGFFTAPVVNLLFEEADCAGDGVIHYEELVEWLCGEDEDIKNSICRMAVTAGGGAQQS